MQVPADCLLAVEPLRDCSQELVASLPLPPSPSLDALIDGLPSIAKELADRVLAAAALLLVAPLLLAIALAVRLTSPGPVIYRQLRSGRGGLPIMVLKFRTMHEAACDAPDAKIVRQAVRGDPRVTALGRILRRLSLDELPQLLNVLKGEMSLVGPRPHALPHDEHYGPLIQGYYARHRVRPGITGWAQVNGCRGRTATLEEMRRRIALDLDYIERWSLRLDLKIMLLTLFAGLVSPDAY